MTKEYDIYIPTVSSDGESLAKVDLKSIRDKLIDHFGGLTDTKQHNSGFWKVGNTVMRDDIVIWRIMGEESQEGDALLKKIQRSLEVALKQDKILIVSRSVDFL